MQENINIPYVKQYDKEGELSNPIDGHYLTSGLNRENRRRPLQKDRFHGESKNHHLTLAGKNGKYFRFRQLVIERDEDGKVTKRKSIDHYVLQINKRK